MNLARPTMTIIRGLPGAGKSTVARHMFNEVSQLYFEADQYFYDEMGNYNFDVKKLDAAHKQCFDKTEAALKDYRDVIVSNTFTTEKEIKSYKKLADKYEAVFISLIVENRHGNKSVHDVPEETMKRMRNRFSIKL